MLCQEQPTRISIVKWMIVVAPVVLVILAPSETLGDVIHVDADASGPTHDGSSWCTAFLTLQDALDIAATGDSILLANGIYTPDPVGLANPREATFQLINGVTIKGGFAGCNAPDPDERDFVANETILSGDLNTNDGPDFANNNENTYHVVTGSDTDATAILDGCTVTGGNANGPSTNDQDRGGGMYSFRGDPEIANCLFRHNFADSVGGGVHYIFSASSFTNCTFKRNSANRGGGMGNFGSTPRLTSCSFLANSTTGGAGAIWNDNSDALFNNCTFSDNAEGALTIVSSGLPRGPTFIDCTFLRNQSRSRGGAISITDGSSPTLTNCLFLGNTSARDGGAISSSSSDTTLINCTLSGNSAVGKGGGVFIFNFRNPLLNNCILWGNTDEDGMDESAQIDVTFHSNGTVVVNNSGIQGGWSGAGTGNISDDPMFVRNPDDGGDGWGVGGNDDFGDLRLSVGSPAIDAGDNNAVPIEITTDLDGNPRFVDDPDTVDTGNGTPPIVDMGAFEFEPGIIVQLDIKPGSDPNSINCNNANAVIPVAVLTTEDFDATNVDHTTVTFGGAGELHVDRRSGEPRRHEEDVDGDGDIDLVFHFSLREEKGTSLIFLLLCRSAGIS